MFKMMMINIIKKKQLIMLYPWQHHDYDKLVNLATKLPPALLINSIK